MLPLAYCCLYEKYFGMDDPLILEIDLYYGSMSDQALSGDYIIIHYMDGDKLLVPLPEKESVVFKPLNRNIPGVRYV